MLETLTIQAYACFGVGLRIAKCPGLALHASKVFALGRLHDNIQIGSE